MREWVIDNIMRRKKMLPPPSFFHIRGDGDLAHWKNFLHLQGEEGKKKQGYAYDIKVSKKGSCKKNITCPTSLTNQVVDLILEESKFQTGVWSGAGIDEVREQIILDTPEQSDEKFRSLQFPLPKIRFTEQWQKMSVFPKLYWGGAMNH